MSNDKNVFSKRQRVPKTADSFQKQGRRGTTHIAVTKHLAKQLREGGFVLAHSLRGTVGQDREVTAAGV